MSGRKRSNRRVRDSETLQGQAQQRLDQIQSRLASELGRAKDTLSVDELVESEQAQNEEVVRLQQEAKFLSEHDSRGVAFATLSSLKEQGYELTDAATEAGVEARFEQAGSEDEVVRVSVESDQSNTEEAYEEILDVYGDDDCIEFLDTYDQQMRERGVEKAGQTDITPHKGGESEVTGETRESESKKRTDARRRDRRREDR